MDPTNRGGYKGKGAMGAKPFLEKWKLWFPVFLVPIGGVEPPLPEQVPVYATAR